jgi:hypothetical protein
VNCTEVFVDVPQLTVGDNKPVIVTVIVELLLTQPPAFLTVKLAVYEPAATPAGTVMLIGLAGNATFVTFAKPPPLQPLMLYVVGAPVVAVYGKLTVCTAAEKHAGAIALNVIVGNALIVTVIVEVVLTQPLAFLTVKLAVYEPAATLAGTVMLIGLAGNAAFVTFAKPPPLQPLMLYVVGAPVVAVYGKLTVCTAAEKHVAAIALNVIVGNALTVTVIT